MESRKTATVQMGNWRRRSGRSTQKCLIAVLVVVMTAAVLVILMGAVEQAASPGIAGVQAELNWHRHSSMTDDHKVPGTVVFKVSKRESLLERLLNGAGGSNIITLDMNQPASSDVTCFQTKTKPDYAVCPHPSMQDRHISNQLRTEGVWQSRTLALLATALQHYPSSTLVDVGAHIGVFSLYGARLGATVVAVEPVWSSAVRLHAGAAAGGVSGRIKILFHAMTREATQVRLKYKDGNLGGTSVVEVTPEDADSTRSLGRHELITSITLDSLAPFINTSIIILKIDTEGRECDTISGGRELLTSHFTPYIFMEWAVMANNRHKYHAPCSPHHLQEMVEWLTSRGYHAHISKSGAALIPAKVDSWRAGDIYWKHSTAPPLHPLAH
ncbi:uncharacterized protein LOC123498102 isoform X2 [Portunus trituberculatus]|uniref:uncharacterized protein LOC123498102 isoform X2 n=1 Tax=Portunus trituberculatus TaxID=210409 RepID=UPI001E1D1FDB|nr:uncharacterized protein LOC123498102 isoform X2 [Portunus trituberculatus]